MSSGDFGLEKDAFYQFITRVSIPSNKRVSSGVHLQTPPTFVTLYCDLPSLTHSLSLPPDPLSLIMAFVSAVPIIPPARASALLNRRSSSIVPTRTTSSTRAPVMSVEFQTYSGGLDRVSIDTYSITRDLFKPARPMLTEEDKDAVIVAGLRQLFGNAYLMEEERAEFYSAESRFRCGEIPAKEFARAVAKSDTYRKRFFESVSQYRFIELNFKHFLGRAPLNQVEYSKHFKIFAEGGYDAEINSYFDDPEYDDVFGEDILPYTRFRGTYAPINQFNRMCALEGGFAGSDKNKPSMLVTSLAANIPTPAFSVADGLPSIPNAEHPSKKFDLPQASLERFKNELEIARARAYQLQVELNKAYRKLSGARAYISPFKAMVESMSTVPVYGRNYGNGSVAVFSGQFQGAPANSWGPSGVANITGPTRRPAVGIAKKEKQLERVKQLIVDLERRIAVLEAERESPALTPEPLEFRLEDMGTLDVEQETAVAGKRDSPTVKLVMKDKVLELDPNDAIKILEALDMDEEDEEDEESGVVKRRAIEISTKRQLDGVGKLPKELIKELEEKTKASNKWGGDARREFPGDGSEMVVGG